MKLYGTLTSPYARLTRIVMLEKGLGDRVELVWTKTRVADDPILAIHPSGRVPALILDDGTVLEDTALIVDYLDALAAPARFAHSADRRDWTYRRVGSRGYPTYGGTISGDHRARDKAGVSSGRLL